MCQPGCLEVISLSLATLRAPYAKRSYEKNDPLWRSSAHLRSTPIWLLRSQIPSSAIFTLLTSLATVRATPEAAALMTAAQPNARAEIFPPSAKLTRSWSASGPSRRSQDFWSDYSSGPIGALPRHTIARTRPSITHQHVARSHQPSETCPLTTFLAPFRADRVTYATTIRGRLAFASAELVEC